MLGRHRSAVCREVSRNEGKVAYRAFSAKRKSVASASADAKVKAFEKESKTAGIRHRRNLEALVSKRNRHSNEKGVSCGYGNARLP